MRTPDVSGHADDVSAGLRRQVSAPMRRTLSAVPAYEEGADLFFAEALLVAGRRVGLRATS